MNAWRVLLVAALLAGCSMPENPVHDLESFQDFARCGAVVEIFEIRGHQVEGAVLTRFGDRHCGIPDQVIVELLEKEYLAWAKEHTKAVVFPIPAGDHWGEAVQGASFWQVYGHEQNDLVVVTQRNSFLLDRYSLLEGEVVYIPLEAVITVFERGWRDDTAACTFACQIVERGCENVTCCRRSSE